MSIEEFEAALDQHGGDIGQWPEALRLAALALLAQSPDARRLFESAARLDAALTPKTPVKAPSDLTNRILAAARRTPPPKR